MVMTVGSINKRIGSRGAGVGSKVEAETEAETEEHRKAEERREEAEDLSVYICAIMTDIQEHSREGRIQLDEGFSKFVNYVNKQLWDIDFYSRVIEPVISTHKGMMLETYKAAYPTAPNEAKCAFIEMGRDKIDINRQAAICNDLNRLGYHPDNTFPNENKWMPSQLKAYFLRLYVESDIANNIKDPETSRSTLWGLYLSI